MILTVPICTARGKHDATCEVTNGEHPFVTSASYAAYFHAERYKADVLEQQVDRGIIRTNDAVNPELLKRISDGVLKSKHTPPIERTYYEARQNTKASKA